MSNKSILLYGKMGTWKTWNCALTAMYVYEKTGKRTRFITADGGGFNHIRAYIDAGIIEPLSIINDSKPINLLRGIIEDRYWPVDINELYERTSTKVSRKGLDEIGAYVFEGVTSISECLMSQYKGKQTGMKPAFSEKLESGFTDEDFKDKNDKGKLVESVVIGGFAMDTYGLIQNEVQDLVIKSWSLPVDTVLWTGHEAEATDELERKVIRGVALVGNAATPRIGKKIGTMIHAYQVPVVKKINNKDETVFETRYYFLPHPDSTFPKIGWDAKSKVPGSQIDELMKKWQGGYFVPSKDEGIVEYLRMEDKLLMSDTRKIKEMKEKIDKERNKE